VHAASEVSEVNLKVMWLCKELGITYPQGLHMADVLEKYIYPEIKRQEG